jgi:hypothetical protein
MEPTNNDVNHCSLLNCIAESLLLAWTFFHLDCPCGRVDTGRVTPSDFLLRMPRLSLGVRAEKSLAMSSWTCWTFFLAGPDLT